MVFIPPNNMVVNFYTDEYGAGLYGYDFSHSQIDNKMFYFGICFPLNYFAGANFHWFSKCIDLSNNKKRPDLLPGAG